LLTEDAAEERFVDIAPSAKTMTTMVAARRATGFNSRVENQLSTIASPFPLLLSQHQDIDT
jgi:hypothetical protein